MLTRRSHSLTCSAKRCRCSRQNGAEQVSRGLLLQPHLRSRKASTMASRSGGKSVTGSRTTAAAITSHRRRARRNGRVCNSNSNINDARSDGQNIVNGQFDPPVISIGLFAWRYIGVLADETLRHPWTQAQVHWLGLQYPYQRRQR